MEILDLHDAILERMLVECDSWTAILSNVYRDDPDPQPQFMGMLIPLYGDDRPGLGPGIIIPVSSIPTRDLIPVAIQATLKEFECHAYIMAMEAFYYRLDGVPTEQAPDVDDLQWTSELRDTSPLLNLNLEEGERCLEASLQRPGAIGDDRLSMIVTYYVSHDIQVGLGQLIEEGPNGEFLRVCTPHSLGGGGRMQIGPLYPIPEPKPAEEQARS